MEVTELGIVMEVKLLQSPNALSPMLVTLLGIVMEVKEVQLMNVPFSMLVNLLGIDTDVKLLQRKTPVHSKERLSTIEGKVL
jgi:hypothetical protein